MLQLGPKVNIMRLLGIILGNWIEFSLLIMCWRMLRMDLWVTRDKYCLLSVWNRCVWSAVQTLSKAIRNFCQPVKSINQLFKRFKSQLSAISFCLFHGNVLVYIFLEKVTFLSKMLGFTVVKSLVTNGSRPIARCFQFIFCPWLCWFYAFKV